MPGTRVEYLSPEPILWLHDAIWYGGQAFIDFLGPAFVPFEPGKRTERVVVRGAAARQGYGDRGADWMFVGVADLRDTGGHNGYPWEWSEDGGHPGVPPVPQRPAGGQRPTRSSR